MSEAIQAVFENLRLELRRGCLILAVLAQLREEHYGYTLRKTLADHGIDIEESTLYPLLRRLETQGLLLSEWREARKAQQALLSPLARGGRHPRTIARRVGIHQQLHSPGVVGKRVV